MNMKFTSGLAAFGLILAACGGAAPAQPKGSIKLNGSGATFPQPLYEDWAFGYSQVDPVAAINYSGGGSGQGKKDILAGTVDYAGSDAALSDDEAKQKPLVQLPMVAGAVVVIYNLADVTDALFLDGKTIGDIYAGKIEKWNDAAIAALNPGLKLPDVTINVAHRSDGSGTTSIFTTYLCAASETWKTAVNPCKGTTVDWPADKLKRGQGGSGNQGVAAAVQKTAGAIGYVELAYAKNNKIPYAQMVNPAGKKIDATIASTTAATTGAKFSDRNAADIVNSASADAWPIAGFTYIILNKDYTDCAKATKLVSWLSWNLTDAAATDRASKLLYAPLGKDTQTLSLNALKTVTCNGQPVLK
ncbi:MAG TPA: phosphate ABC transporter substrate-binding protein PstS [Thermoflexales bacterium]|nr:phosphate ABC transporter substrate-binding protein PstS [Thermoflexales bacterium]HQW35216.1 phosphate ABC transporter substrate-binding protein PstS [Thermoflexales bacterium]HRA01170.1 phosphate ABC transporter substrate-binding protein PstS [Thermoflexales bacterium]